jgi:hypothetical protein
LRNDLFRASSPNAISGLIPQGRLLGTNAVVARPAPLHQGASERHREIAPKGNRTMESQPLLKLPLGEAPPPNLTPGARPGITSTFASGQTIYSTSPAMIATFRPRRPASRPVMRARTRVRRRWSAGTCPRRTGGGGDGDPDGDPDPDPPSLELLPPDGPSSRWARPIRPRAFRRGRERLGFIPARAGRCPHPRLLPPRACELRGVRPTPARAFRRRGRGRPANGAPGAPVALTRGWC